MRLIAYAMVVLASCRAADAPTAQAPRGPEIQPEGAWACETVPLAHARAQAVADTLNELMRASERAAALRGFANGSCALYPPGVFPAPSEPRSRFLADVRSNSVLVFAAVPADLPRIRELIERLDVEGFEVER